MKTISKIFEQENERIKKFTKKLDVADNFIYFDYSKTHLEESQLNTYFEKWKHLKQNVEDMFHGLPTVNFTEKRRVLHVSLRDKDIISKLRGKEMRLCIANEKLDILEEIIKMKRFSKAFHNGEIRGVTGKKIDTIVNIGIGGSDLGPRMVCEALEFYKINNTKVYFISNVDGTDTKKVFDVINPETTIFIVVSKTFTTIETLTNARLSLNLMKEHLKKTELEITRAHFVAISSNAAEVEKFGVETKFDMWDYVGGRYSMWSCVGLSICLYIGFENFLNFLEGASIMDEHFRYSEMKDNIPLMHSIVELYYNNQLDYNNKCILPYDQFLEKLPSYLQQAEMESNGKSATKEGLTKKNTGMIVWGGIGTNSQHSFFQLLHQGSRKILCEFLLPLTPLIDYKLDYKSLHTILSANCIAQSRALMVGKESKDDIHKNFEGDKPSITVCYSKLTPAILGALIALYEHKIFVQGLFWGINSFDQFGVELGKKLAIDVFDKLIGKNKESMDKSTDELIKVFRQFEKGS